VCTAGIIVVGVADRLTGPDLVPEPFYLLPLVVAAVVLPRRGVFVLFVLMVATRLVADYSGDGTSATAIMLWNVGVGGLMTLIVVLLVKRLARDYHRAEAAEERSREFLAMAAHQLRTPLTSIQTTADNLINDSLDPAQEDRLARLATEARRCGRLVAGLLKIAELDQPHELVLEPVDVLVVCRHELARLEPFYPGVVMSIESHDESLTVTSSPNALEDIVSNLASNAARHAEHRVTIAVRSIDHRILISVIDDGPGLPPGFERQAFDRFVSLDGMGGCGLGLFIASRQAEMLGGTLHYDEGAFAIEIPIQLLATDRTTRIARSESEQPA
jgi:signal transduction histidine kinase